MFSPARISLLGTVGPNAEQNRDEVDVERIIPGQSPMSSHAWWMASRAHLGSSRILAITALFNAAN